MSKSIFSAADRIVRLTASAIAGAPANNTQPHIIQSATVGGLLTRGYGLALLTPDSGVAVTPIVSGLSLTVYRLVTTLGRYAAGFKATGLALDSQFVNFDFSAEQRWYFVIDPATVAVDGDILFAFTELA